MTPGLLALLLSALALVASCWANSIAQRALAESSKVKLLELQAEVLREVDLQHASFGSLLAVTAEAALLYIQNPTIAANNHDDHERLKQNINTVQSLSARYEEQRVLAESNFGKGDIEEQTKILANIRRLTLHVQEDVKKELRHVERLREQVFAALS